MGNKHGKTTSRLNPQSIKELQNNVEVDFSTEEIQEWYNEFKSSCKNGKNHLTKDEFKKVYNSLFSGDATEFAEHVFRTFDKDGNKTVDFQEFILGLCVSGSTDIDKKINWAFDMYDINGDGFISKEEMTHIFTAIIHMTNTHLPPDIGSPEQLTNKLFSEYDTNKDDLISRNEFNTCAHSDELVLAMLQCDPDIP